MDRIKYLDFIKGIAIFLVVWGHTIQNMGDGNDFWENPIHEFICSFHMPIFMVVSGFFFKNVIEKSIIETTKKKFTQLIIPCFGWSAVLVLIGTCHILYDGIIPSPLERIKMIFYETGTRFWFLRSVFICYILASISMKTFKKDTLACLFSILLFLALPDNGRLHLDKFMYPFFWLGYFLHKYIKTIIKYRTPILFASLTVFTILFFYWEKEDYIYITGMSFYDIQHGNVVIHSQPERFLIILYRYLIGLSGSLFVFVFLQRIYHTSFQIIAQLGTYTLGIYTIHILVEGNLLRLFDLSHTSFLLYNFVVTPLVSVILILFCIGLIKLIEKNDYATRLFLGKQTKGSSKLRKFS